MHHPKFFHTANSAQHSSPAKALVARSSTSTFSRRASWIVIAVIVAVLVIQRSGAQAASGPKAYIGLFKDNAVAVLDTNTRQVLKTIPVPMGPHGMAVSLDGRSVYVSSDGDTKVSVIDTRTDTISQTIEVGKAPHGLTLTPDGTQLIVSVFGAGQVVFIDTATNQILGQVAVPSPHNSAVSPDGKTAYVSTNYAADADTATVLTILDLANRTSIGSVPLSTTTQTARSLNFGIDGKTLYFTQTGVSAVQVLDPTTHSITAQIATGASPHHVLATPNGKYVLVVSQTANELDIIDPHTNTIYAKIPVGQKPHWIGLDASGSIAYVTNENDNTVSVVDLETQQVKATIPVGNAPRKIVIQSVLPGIAATANATLAATPNS